MMKPPDFTKPPDFIGDNKPRHEALEQWKRLADPKDEANHATFALGPPQGTIPVPRSLVEMYQAVPRLQQDVLLRPDHYTPRQQEIIAALSTGRELATPPTTAEKNELVLRLTEDTATAAASAKIVERAEKTIMMDGRTLEQSVADDATFQNQKYDEEIVII